MSNEKKEEKVLDITRNEDGTLNIHTESEDGSQQVYEGAYPTGWNMQVDPDGPLQIETVDVQFSPINFLRAAGLNEPRWGHDCDVCVYRGTVEFDEVYDLYHCEKAGCRTYIARYHYEGPSYISFPEFVLQQMPPLEKAGIVQTLLALYHSDQEPEKVTLEGPWASTIQALHKDHKFEPLFADRDPQELANIGGQVVRDILAQGEAEKPLRDAIREGFVSSETTLIAAGPPRLVKPPMEPGTYWNGERYVEQGDPEWAGSEFLKRVQIPPRYHGPSMLRFLYDYYVSQTTPEEREEDLRELRAGNLEGFDDE